MRFCTWNVRSLSTVGEIKSVVGKLVKMGLREIGIDGANWIRLAQDKVQWQAFVSAAMNLRVP
jgi:hypothetical protein